MLKTKTLNKTITTILITLLTLAILRFSNFIVFVPKVEAVTVKTGNIYVNASKTTPSWGNGEGTSANPYWNITKALTECTGDAIIHVGPGTYNKTLETFPLTINDVNVTIQSTDGRDSTIINATGEDSPAKPNWVFYITAENATIGGNGAGFILDASVDGVGGNDDEAVIEVHANRTTIQGNKIIGIAANTPSIHINMSKGMGHTVQDNVFRKKATNVGWGVWADDLSDSLIEGNLFYGDSPTFGSFEGAPACCISIGEANNVNISSNTAYNVKYNLVEFYAAFLYNHTTWGQYYESGHNTTISNIRIENNTAYDLGYTPGAYWRGGGVHFKRFAKNDTACPRACFNGSLTIGSNVIIGPNNNFTSNAYGVKIDPNRTKIPHSGYVFGADNIIIYYNNIRNSTEYGVWNGQEQTVNATLNWWGNSSGPGYTGGVGGLGTGDYISDPTYVQYVPWLNAVYPGGVSTSPFNITPSATKGSVQKWFNITVQNIGSPAAVDYVNVSYPSSFTLHTYNYPTGWQQSHDISGKTVTFTATGGYQFDSGESGGFDFQMTTSGSSDDFKVLCRNLMGGHGFQNLTISVDAQAPTVTVPALPTYYSVEDGNRIYINGTINDNTYSTPSLAINDTTYFPTNPQVLIYNASATDYTWYFRYYNTSTVPDGYLAVNITGTDAAGNVETGGNVVYATIDNTAPTLMSLVVADDQIGNLTSIGNTFYMSGDATGLNFTIMFSEAHPYNNVTYIFNGTGTTTTKTFQNNTWFYSGSDAWYNVTGVNTVTIYNITIVDAALPNNNTLTTGNYTIIRDQVGPTVPTYNVTEICGGLVIKNLNSTDNVGVDEYEVYINGTSFLNVTATQLANTTLDWVTGALNRSCVFDGTLVLNLTSYAGGHANLTIRAIDIGGNRGNFSATVYTIAEERWYAIELQANWNLIGLPLVPASTAKADVLSLILKQGAAGVRFMYGYNNITDAWTLNPTTITDGKGYWMNMEAYDVMIVSGRISPEPPAMPPSYNLTIGWELTDYKCISSMTVTAYLASLTSGSYLTNLYTWNAQTQSWAMKSGSDNLEPGWGFWIYMYSSQILIPPIP